MQRDPNERVQLSDYPSLRRLAEGPDTESAQRELVGAVARLLRSDDLAELTSALANIERIRGTSLLLESGWSLEILDALNVQLLAAVEAERGRRYRVGQAALRGSVRERVLDRISKVAGRPVDLARDLEISAPQVSRAIADLCEDGLVELDVSEEKADGRSRQYRCVQPKPSEDLQIILNLGDAVSSTGLTTVGQVVEARRTGTRGSVVVGALSAIAASTHDRQNDVAHAVAELATTWRERHELGHAEYCARWLHLRGIETRSSATCARALYELGRCELLQAPTNRKGAGLLAESIHLWHSGLQDLSASDAYRVSARIGWANVGLAEDARRNWELEPAHNYVTAALDAFEQLEDRYGRASCLGQRGFIRRLQGKNADAVSDLTASLKLSRELDYSRCEAHALLQLGELERQKGSDGWEDAMRHVRGAHNVFKKLGGSSFAFALGAMGALEFDVAVADSAERSRRQGLQKAVELLGRSADELRSDHLDGYALMQRRLGAAFRELEMYDASEKAFTSALAMYASRTDPVGSIEASLGRSELRIRRDRIDDAVSDAVNIASTASSIASADLTIGIASRWVRFAWSALHGRLQRYVTGTDDRILNLVPVSLSGVDDSSSAASEMGQETGQLAAV